jgi:hypothetical protein
MSYKQSFIPSNIRILWHHQAKTFTSDQVVRDELDTLGAVNAQPLN